ncbi:MAG: transporter substrate-binding domain-containing protein [Synergistales bacterium]|nr:transporter substrate-binding domain-containing protein [Synergistales bacterium]
MKKITVLVIFFVFVIVLSGPLHASSVMDRKTFLVGTEPTFRPFSFRSSENRIVGFDLDLVRWIGIRLGLEVRVVGMPFHELIPSLLMKKVDLVASGMVITPERARKITFSDVYFSIPDAIVTRVGETGIRGVEDLSGRTAAVQEGSARERFVSDLDDVNVRTFREIDALLREVLDYRADFGVVDHNVAQGYLSNIAAFEGKLEIAFLHRDTREGMGFALRRDDPEFLEAVNRAIGELRKEGILEMLEQKWLEDRTFP